MISYTIRPADPATRSIPGSEDAHQIVRMCDGYPVRALSVYRSSGMAGQVAAYLNKVVKQEVERP